MSRSEHHRGAAYLAHGSDVIAAAQDRRLPPAVPDPAHEDLSSLQGALLLKRRIIAYWAARGREVSCTVEPGPFGMVVVRSDLKPLHEPDGGRR